MRNTFKAVLLATSILLSSLTAHAAEKNAAPLGLELGVATMADVKKEIGKNSQLTDEGENKYTGGPMIGTTGEGLEIEGLTNVLFIFDKSEKLAGAILTMGKDPKAVFKTLSAKYKVKFNKIDKFMNYGTARLEKGDSIIEINSPHMRFDMDVIYITKALEAQYSNTKSAEATEKQKRKASAL